MSFIWPVMLVLLLFVPLAAVAYLGLERRRRRRIAGLGLRRASTGATFALDATDAAATDDGAGAAAATAAGTSTFARVRRRFTGGRRYLPFVTVLAGLTVMVVALARPQAVVAIPHDEGTIILAFDVSGSMAADDFAPTRMEAAKAAARDFVKRQPPSVVIGVVAFSDTGFSVQVPTNDPAPILAAIDRLAPQRGTSLAQGIGVSLDTIAAAEGDQTQGYYTNRSPDPNPTPAPSPVPPGTHTSAVIVLITDGENTVNPDPLVAAQVAADRGVRIHTIGIGSAAGTTIKTEGFTVHTQLDAATLQQIASMTGGNYYEATTADDLQSIYDTLDTRVVVKAAPMEVTSIFAGASIVLLLVGAVSSLFWLGRMP